MPTGLSNVVAVAAGWEHSLALKSDGQVIAWGGISGQSELPKNGLGNVVAVAAGGSHNLALLADGHVVTWGRYGDDRGVAPPIGLSSVIAVAAGGGHDLALTADGYVVAWGNNHSGQTDVPAGLHNVIAIAAGSAHSLALTAEGQVVAWGSNVEHDWVALDTGQATVPNDLPRIVAIAAGRNHSLALTAEGRVVAWGSNFSGGFQNGLYTGQADVPDGLSNVVAITGGSSHSLALLERPHGTAVPELIGPRNIVAAAGWSFFHQIVAKNGVTIYGASGLPSGLVLDQGTGQITGVPEQAGTYIVTLFATNSLGFDVKELSIHVNPPPQPWMRSGDLVIIELGQPARFRNQASYATQFQAEGLPRGLTIDSHSGVISGVPEIEGDYTVTLRASNTDGEVISSIFVRVTPIIAWGFNYQGSTDAPAGLSNVVTIAAGGHHNLALSGAGHVVAWGDNGSGQTDVPNPLSNVVMIAAGGGHSLALTDAGQVFAWGYNGPPDAYYGQAVVPSDLSNVVAVAAGENHSLAVTADGRVVGWGLNRLGQTDVPIGLSNVVAVAAGDNHSLALTEEGFVVAWGVGTNDTGEWPQLGQSQVPFGLSNVVAVAAGASHSLALTVDGHVMAWGAIATSCCPAVWENPVVPIGLSNVVAIAAGHGFSLALIADGSVVGWGFNESGQVNIPDGPRKIFAIAAGESHSLALVRYAPPPVTLQLTQFPEGLELNWSSGLLQFAPELSGPWTDLPAANPFKLSPIGEKGFFRVKVEGLIP